MVSIVSSERRALVASPHEALDQLLCRNLERDHGVEGEAARQSPLMRELGLFGGAREAVEHEAGERFGPETYSSNSGIINSSGTSSPLVEKALDPESDLAPFGYLSPEDLAGREMGNAVDVGEDLPWVPFPAPGGATSRARNIRKSPPATTHSRAGY